MTRSTRSAWALGLAALTATAACGDDPVAPPTNPPPAAGSAVLTGNITSSRTLSADTTYTLSGFVKVTNGAVLTIPAGTKLVGDTAVAGSSLWITRGSRIEANGTAAAPIVFTSARAAGNRRPGDWGGLIIIGNGIINRTGSPILTEGPATEAENYAGGTNNADNSGTLRYVRVEFAGFDVSQGMGQELNSVSMYAVGSGTQLEYVESMAGLDDSFEWWGGAVQGRYLLSYESGDDHFDWSEGFRGKLQYIVAFQSTRLQPAPGTGTFSSDPRGIEADGCDPGVSGCVVDNTTFTNSSQPYSLPTIANFTIVGAANDNAFPATSAVVLRRGTGAYLANGIAARYKEKGLECRDAQTGHHLTTDSLQVIGMLFAENTVGSYDLASEGSRYCQATNFTGDGHRDAAGGAASLFESITPPNLDWNGAAEATSGGQMIDPAFGSGFFGGTMANTAYVGAAPAAGGAEWWAGWSVYLVD